MDECENVNFSVRGDTISRDPPQCWRWINPLGRWCWWNSSLTTLSWTMKTLIARGLTLDWPEFMWNADWDSNNDATRPLLSFLHEYVFQNETGLQSPVPMLRAFIHQCLDGDMTRLERTGFCTDLFQFSLAHPDMEDFFQFLKPTITTTTRTSSCTTCEIEATYSERSNPECLLELKDIDRNLTLEDLILNHFNDQFISEESDCRVDGCHGHVRIDTKYSLVTLPQAFVVKIGVEQLEDGAFLQRQKISLGGNVTLTNQIGENKQYELLAAIVHTGQTVNTGHFIAYLKKDSIFHQFNDGQIILERPESFVETADIFIFVAITPNPENLYE